MVLSALATSAKSSHADAEYVIAAMLASARKYWAKMECSKRMRESTESTRPKVSSAYANIINELCSIYDDASINEEIEGLLFSDGPLTCDQGPQGDNFLGFDDGSLLPVNFSFDDTDE